MPNSFEAKYKLLENEIVYIKDVVTNFDNQLFKIKGWAITLWTGVIFFGFKTNSFIFVVISLVFSIVVSVLFLFVESTFKGLQRGYIIRSNRINKYLLSSQFEIDFTNKRFSEHFNTPDPNGFNTIKDYRHKTSILAGMRSLNVYGLYLGLILLSVIGLLIISYLHCSGVISDALFTDKPL